MSRQTDCDRLRTALADADLALAFQASVIKACVQDVERLRGLLLSVRCRLRRLDSHQDVRDIDAELLEP